MAVSFVLVYKIARYHTANSKTRQGDKPHRCSPNLVFSALPDRNWSVDDVYNVVRSSPAVVTERLEFFTEAGMLTRSGEPPVYRYQPRTEQLGQAISSISVAYKLSRHRIVELIYAPSRMDDPLTSFTDAFRFKKRE